MVVPIGVLGSNRCCDCHRYHCCYCGFRRYNCQNCGFRPMSRYCCVNRCSCCPTSCCFVSMKTSRRYMLMTSGLCCCFALSTMSCFAVVLPKNCVWSMMSG